MQLTTESEFLEYVTQDLTKISIERGEVASKLKIGLKRQEGFAEILENIIRSGYSKQQWPQYGKYYLTRPWPGRWYYRKVSELFRFQPTNHLELISSLNNNFYPYLYHRWDSGIKLMEGSTSDYYKTRLAGSSVDAQDEAKRLLDQHLKEAGRWPVIGSKMAGRYSEMQESKFWTNYQGSLFPLGYRHGKDGYGRMSMIPGSTLCNSKRTYKACLLELVNSKSGVNFFEVDLKGCHLSIFRDLFDWRGRSDYYKLPERGVEWPTMLRQFTKIHEENRNEKFWESKKVDQLLENGGKPIIGLLKNQTYKSLNGGNPQKCNDNVKNSKNRLGIDETQVNSLANYLERIFSDMDMFELLIDFMNQLTLKPYLYLPNQVEPFNTDTLSKKQKGFKETAVDLYEMKGNTCNSRLFSSFEFCVIIHVLIAIRRANVPWLVIGYEADGVLIATEETVSEAIEKLEQVNGWLTDSMQTFTSGSQKLEIKPLFKE